MSNEIVKNYEHLKLYTLYGIVNCYRILNNKLLEDNKEKFVSYLRKLV